MTRAREFDEEASVEGAMRLFWQKGFDAAPLPELLDAMQLSRGSFYNAFGAKKNVLIEAIQRYMDGVLLPLFRPEAGRKGIEQAFARMVAHTAGPQGRVVLADIARVTLKILD